MSSVRFGMVADVHHADLPTMPWSDGVFYRLARERLADAVGHFRFASLDFVIELGDFKDLARRQFPGPDGDDRDMEKTAGYLREIEDVFRSYEGPRYHVLGNHDNDLLGKREFFSICPNTGIDPARSYYSFVVRGVTFIVLDGNFNKDGEAYTGVPLNWCWEESLIADEELDWLEEELRRAPGHVVVFVHQRLDAEARPNHRILNAGAVQRILARSGKVRAVFQGHDHLGGYSVADGIGYYTLRALVAGPGEADNAYADVEVRCDGDIVVTGFGQAKSVRIDSQMR